MTLVGAAGNAGPKSPPLYPAADENVVAVSATDADDAVYPMANAGPYIAVAAPGVDVLLPAPNGGYAMKTGTSVSAALVSGIAALMIERRPEASPSELKVWLEKTARPIGGGRQGPRRGRPGRRAPGRRGCGGTRRTAAASSNAGLLTMGRWPLGAK